MGEKTKGTLGNILEYSINVHCNLLLVEGHLNTYREWVRIKQTKGNFDAFIGIFVSFQFQAAVLSSFAHVSSTVEIVCQETRERNSRKY